MSASPDPIRTDPIRTPSGVLVPAGIDPFHRRLHRIAPAALVDQTSQTSGMRRLEAISGRTVGARHLWMGQTHVPAATNSGNHHHGASETAIFVISGTPVFVFVDLEGDEPVETRVQTAPGDYIFVPPYVPHREENPDPTTRRSSSSPAPPRTRSWSTSTTSAGHSRRPVGRGQPRDHEVRGAKSRRS